MKLLERWKALRASLTNADQVDQQWLGAAAKPPPEPVPVAVATPEKWRCFSCEGKYKTNNEKLNAIIEGYIERRPLLNRQEIAVHTALEQFIQKHNITLGIALQVSMAEFLKVKSNRELFFLFNSWRNDFCLYDDDYNVVAVIEYNGGGHYGKTDREFNKAANHDIFKEAICKQAGILFYSIDRTELNTLADVLERQLLKPLKEKLGDQEWESLETASPHSAAAYNTKSGYYQIMESSQQCFKCKQPTRVYGFLLPDTASTLSTEEGDAPTWIPFDEPTVVYFIEALSEHVLAQMACFTPQYRLGSGGRMGFPYWMNHCEHCGASQWDSMYYKEGGAFCGDNPNIIYHDIDDQFLALRH